MSCTCNIISCPQCFPTLSKVVADLEPKGPALCAVEGCTQPGRWSVSIHIGATTPDGQVQALTFHLLGVLACAQCASSIEVLDAWMPIEARKHIEERLSTINLTPAWDTARVEMENVLA